MYEVSLEQVRTRWPVRKILYLTIKRLFDICVGVVGLILALPIMILVKIANICTGDFGPLFFKHKRIGKNGETIYLYKFRSMVVNAEDLIKTFTPEQKAEYEQNYKLDYDFRITKVGKIIRKTSIDEVPQVLNILKGDMSVVGPRPLVEGEIEKYGKNKDKFLSVTPGLTGWWACNGRNCRSYKDRIKLELYYIDHMSLWLDIKVLFKTVGAVIRGHGAK